MYCTEFLAKLFGLTFWQNLVPTLIGSLIGVYIAFWLEHRRSRKQEKEQQESLYKHLTLYTFALFVQTGLCHLKKFPFHAGLRRSGLILARSCKPA